MGCGCGGAAKAAEVPMDTNQVKLKVIQCKGCGISRCLPEGIQEDGLFELVPCPKCGVGFKGRFHSDILGVEELD